jgi:hypothetical protein
MWLAVNQKNIKSLLARYNLALTVLTLTAEMKYNETRSTAFLTSSVIQIS